MDKQKSRIKVTEVFNISSKLRERDAVTVNGIRGRVESLTKSHPLELWDAIHVKGVTVTMLETISLLVSASIAVLGIAWLRCNCKSCGMKC